MNLDKHIKQKFNEQNFEFKEEYWQAASALIDQHQKGKKKMRIIIRWASIFTFLLMVGTVLFVFFPEQKNSDVSLTPSSKVKEEINTTNSGSYSYPESHVSKNKSDNAISEHQNSSIVKSNDQKDIVLSNTSLNNTKQSSSKKISSVDITNSSTPKTNLISNQNLVAEHVSQPLADEKLEAHLEQDQSNPLLSWDDYNMTTLGIQPFIPSTAHTQEKKDNSKPLFYLPYFSVGLYAGIHSSQRSIEVKEAFNSVLKDKKTSEENTQSSYNVGIEGQYYFKQRWSVSLGAEYMSYVENINYSGIDKNSTHINDESYYDIKDSSFWNSGWVMIDSMPRFLQYASYHVVKDSTFIQKSDTTVSKYTDENIKSLNGQNRYSYIEVPILVGYQFPYKSFEIQLQSGLSMGFLQSHQAKYAVDNEDYNNQSLVNIKQQVSNLILRVSVLYPLNQQTYLYLQPAYKTQITNSVEAQGGFAQRFSSYHVNLGVRYLFR